MRRILSIILIFLLCIFLRAEISNAQTKPGWPKLITAGSATLGSVYYIWFGGFTKLLYEKMGIPSSVEMTAGPVHNAKLVASKKLEFGGVTAAIAYEAFHGTGWTKGEKYQELRVILPIYTSYFQMYALNKSGIKSIYDLNGRSVGVAPVGSTPATYYPIIFEIAGIKPARIVNASPSDLNSQVKDGMLDTNGNCIGLPWVIISEVELTHGINVFGVPGEVASKFSEKYPSFTLGSIPKGTYKSNKDYDIPTANVWAFVVTNKYLPEDFIYEVVKRTYENVDILIATHKSAEEVKPQNIVHSPIPLHPGAIRYYNEIGIKVPDRLIPK